MPDSRSVYKARVDSAIMFVHDHLAEDLNLEDLANAANFSAFHFHRIFSAMMGETPQQFLNRVRLERAANMLVKNPTRSITWIARDCGFSSSATFARSFNKYFGGSATQYHSAENKPAPPGVNSMAEGQDKLPGLDITVRNVPSWNLVYFSVLKGYRIDPICKAWDQLFRWASAHDLISEEPRVLGISLDDPMITPANKCRYYACITLTDEITTQPPVGFLRLSGSKCAVAHITCNIEQIQGIYMYLYRHWLLDSGFQPADLPPYEIYLSTPEDNPAGQYDMDIYIPIIPL